MTAVARGVRFIKNLFSDGNNMMAQSSAKITAAATKTISASANRILAAVLPGGDTQKEINKMDNLKAQLDASKTQAEYDANLKKLYDYVFNTESFFGKEIPSLVGNIKSGVINDNTNLKKEQRLFERLGKYGVNFQGYNYTDRIQTMAPGQTNDPNQINDLQTNILGTQPNNQRIKIMPMYGDLDDYANAEDSPQIKILKKQLEVANAQLEE